MFIRNKEKNESTRNRFFGREPVFFLSFSYFLVFFYKFSLCSPKELTFKWYLFYIFELVYHFQLKAPTLIVTLIGIFRFSVRPFVQDMFSCKPFWNYSCLKKRPEENAGTYRCFGTCCHHFVPKGLNGSRSNSRI